MRKKLRTFPLTIKEKRVLGCIKGRYKTRSEISKETGLRRDESNRIVRNLLEKQIIKKIESSGTKIKDLDGFKLNPLYYHLKPLLTSKAVPSL